MGWLHEEVKSYSLLLMDYVIRGALLTPVNESERKIYISG
jgi:hypothetical protein